MPHLDDLELLAAVVEAGGFRPAAQRLGLPASTVSDVVRRLEQELNVRLLHCSTRSVKPTDAGRRLLARIKPAFALIDQAFLELNDDDALPVGPLRLTAPGIVARYVLPAIVPGFLLAHPAVQVEVRVDEAVVDIVDGGFDAAIRYEERVTRDMIAVPIGPRTQRFVAAAAPSYLARHGRPRHPSELAHHQLIGHRLLDGAMLVWEFQQGGRTVRITPQGPLATASIDLRLAAVVAGAGLLYTFEDVLRPHLDAGALEPVLEPWWQSFSGPRLCHHGDRRVPGPLRAFKTYVETQALNT